MSAARSCRKPLKGASPVPGPTMITGAAGAGGSRKLEWRTNTGTAPPSGLALNQLEQTPSCTRPAGVTQAETVRVEGE